MCPVLPLLTSHWLLPMRSQVWVERELIGKKEHISGELTLPVTTAYLCLPDMSDPILILTIPSGIIQSVKKYCVHNELLLYSCLFFHSQIFNLPLPNSKQHVK